MSLLKEDSRRLNPTGHNDVEVLGYFCCWVALQQMKLNASQNFGNGLLSGGFND